MKKSELRKIIREAIEEMRLDENKPCTKWCISLQHGFSYCCGWGPQIGMTDGSKGTKDNPIPIQGTEPTNPQAHRAPTTDRSSAKTTAGGPCICRNWQMGTDGTNKCIEWSPAGCGDAPFKVATNNPQIA